MNNVLLQLGGWIEILYCIPFIKHINILHILILSFIYRITVLFILNSEATSISLAMTKVGKIDEIPHEIKQIQWEISDIFSHCKNGKHFESTPFTVAGIPWHFRMQPNWKNSVALCLESPLDDREYSIEYYIGLKKRDGYVEQFISGIMETDDDVFLVTPLIKNKELLLRKTELAPRNILTVVCTMKIIGKVFHSAQPTALDEVKLISKL